jgi:hypothetical protein
LHIRTDDSLDKLIDSAVKELKEKGIPANRSSVARMLIRQSLDGRGTEAAGEALKQVLTVSERVLAQALKDVMGNLPARVEQELTG